jgi:hypothetical protein
MSAPPNGIPPGMPSPPKILLPQVATIQCVGCQNQIQVRLPRPRMANAPDVTVIAFAHENLDKCPHCGTKYLFQVHGIDQNGTMEFLWLPVREQPKIIPGTQQNLAVATSNDEVAKKIKIN